MKKLKVHSKFIRPDDTLPNHLKQFSDQRGSVSYVFERWVERNVKDKNILDKIISWEQFQRLLDLFNNKGPAFAWKEYVEM